MRALITGITGQDGSYLAEHLARLGYDVWGIVRGQDNPRHDWLTELVPGATLVDGDLLDSQSLHAAVAQCQPDEVYNLGAISSPGLAWKQPVLTAEVTGLGALRLFEAVRVEAPKARVVQASSIALHGPYGAAHLGCGLSRPWPARVLRGVRWPSIATTGAIVLLPEGHRWRCCDCAG
jgi:GDP-D-mannose dehydratase